MLFEGEIVRVLMGVARALAWAHSAPLIGDRIISPKIRGAACVPLGFAISQGFVSTTYHDLVRVLPAEILLGLSLGFTSRLLFLGAEFGGQLVGVQLGLGFAQSYDPTSGEESLPTRRIAGVLAGLSFLGMGGIENVIRSLAISGLALRFDGDAFQEIFRTSGLILSAGFAMAGPMLLAGFVANVAVALAARAAPALNAFSVMLALFLLVGGFVLFGTTSSFVQQIEGLARMASEAPWRLLAR